MTSQTNEFQDEWGDLSPSFEDQLSRHTCLLESARESFKHENRRNLTHRQEIQPQRKKPAFQVYLDPPHEKIDQPKRVYDKQPLKEIQLNQQISSPVFEKHEVHKQEHVKKAHTLDTARDSEIQVPSPSIGDDPEFDIDDDDMWTEFDTSILSMFEGSGGTSEKPNSTKINDGQANLSKADALNDSIQHDKVGSNINQFGGFMTAGSKKKLESGTDARKKALALFEDASDDKSLANPSNNLHDSIDKHAIHAIPVMTTGFTTGRGNPVKAASSAAMRRAEKLFEETRKENEVSAPLEDITSANNRSESPKCGEKRAADEEFPAEFKYENILSQYGGFRMGSGRAGITVSAEAKRQAVALFNSDSTCRDLTQSTQLVNTDSQLSPPNTPERSQESSTNLLEFSSGENALQSTKNSSATTSTQKSTQESPIRLRNKRITALRGKVKPFKSPLIEGNLEKTKAAINKSVSSVRCKGEKVFNMTSPTPRYSLSKLGAPLKRSISELEAKHIPSDVLYMSARTSEIYTFNGWGPENARNELIKAGALERLLPQGWVENHYRWIVWKIACMIRSYPDNFGDWWTPKKITEQLLYRYEREVNMGQRSALKRIIEQDDIPTKHMILVVADIVAVEHSHESVFGEGQRRYQLLLTDGWYSIPAVADPRMERAIREGKLRVGQKLSICGAQLIGNREAKSPLNANHDTQLQISSNSCQPATWDAKLGYQRRRVLFRSLSTIHAEGGLVTAIDVIICRKYQMFYTETLPNGTTITRTSREEDEFRQRFIGDMASFNNLDGLLPNFQEDSSSPSSLLLAEKSRDSIIQNNRRTTYEERNVSAYFRIRICDYPVKRTTTAKQDADSASMTLLITNANEITFMDICEGARYRIYFVVPYTRKKDLSIELKTTRNTRWEMLPLEPSDEALSASAYIPRHTIPCCSLPFVSHASDVDLAGVVLHVSEPRQEKYANNRIFWYQSLFLTDETTVLCHLTLRLPSRPLPNVDGQVVAFLNLRFDKYDTKYNVAHLRWTDDSEVCSQQGSASYLQRSIRNTREWLRSQPDDVRAVHEKVQSLLNHT